MVAETLSVSTFRSLKSWETILLEVWKVEKPWGWCYEDSKWGSYWPKRQRQDETCWVIHKSISQQEDHLTVSLGIFSGNRFLQTFTLHLRKIILHVLRSSFHKELAIYLWTGFESLYTTQTTLPNWRLSYKLLEGRKQIQKINYRQVDAFEVRWFVPRMITITVTSSWYFLLLPAGILINSSILKPAVKIIPFF